MTDAPAADHYRRLGLRPVINAATYLTRLGGMPMAPEVVAAMTAASHETVNLHDLLDDAGLHLARLTNNPAACVTNGAAAGLTLAVAACMTGDDIGLMERLPDNTAGMRNEVVIQRAHRNWYDVGIRQAGARIVEVGHIETEPGEITRAITERTAAVVFFAGPMFQRQFTASLSDVVAEAHARGIPVIVEAASQLPPADNLWHYTRDVGADLAIFSGGKGLAGPQNSGLVVGRADLIRAMTLLGPPHQRLGRGMKVSKEAVIGLIAAVERYLTIDHHAEKARWNAVTANWRAAWTEAAAEGVAIAIDPLNFGGEPIPRVTLDYPSPSGATDAVAALRAGDPPIEVMRIGANTIAASPHCLHPGEERIVERRIAAHLAAIAAG